MELKPEWEIKTTPAEIDTNYMGLVQMLGDWVDVPEWALHSPRDAATWFCLWSTKETCKIIGERADIAERVARLSYARTLDG